MFGFRWVFEIGGVRHLFNICNFVLTFETPRFTTNHHHRLWPKLIATILENLIHWTVVNTLQTRCGILNPFEFLAFRSASQSLNRSSSDFSTTFLPCSPLVVHHSQSPVFDAVCSFRHWKFLGLNRPDRRSVGTVCVRLIFSLMLLNITRPARGTLDCFLLPLFCASTFARHAVLPRSSCPSTPGRSCSCVVPLYC